MEQIEEQKKKRYKETNINKVLLELSPKMPTKDRNYTYLIN